MIRLKNMKLALAILKPVRLGGGDDEERRPGAAEQLVGGVGPLAEAAEHGVQR